MLTFGNCLALSISTLEVSCFGTAVVSGGGFRGTSGLRSSGVHISSSEKLLEALFCRDTLSRRTLRTPVSKLVAAGPGLKFLLLNLNEGIPVLLWLLPEAAISSWHLSSSEIKLLSLSIRPIWERKIPLWKFLLPLDRRSSKLSVLDPSIVPLESGDSFRRTCGLLWADLESWVCVWGLVEERWLGGLPLSNRCWFLRVVSLSTSLGRAVGLPLQEVLLLKGTCVDGLGRPLLVLLGSGFGEGSLVLCRGMPEPGWARGRLFTFTPPLMVAQSQKLKKRETNTMRTSDCCWTACTLSFSCVLSIATGLSMENHNFKLSDNFTYINDTNKENYTCKTLVCTAMDVRCTIAFSGSISELQWRTISTTSAPLWPSFKEDSNCNHFMNMCYNWNNLIGWGEGLAGIFLSYMLKRWKIFTLSE